MKTNAPPTLLPGGRHTITLTGRLPDVTNYSGWLALKYGNQSPDLHPGNQAFRQRTPVSAGGRSSGQRAAQRARLRRSNRQSRCALAMASRESEDLIVAVTGLQRQDGQPLEAEKLTCSSCDERDPL